MVETYQFVQLLAIAQCGTLSKAAEELHLSQPALSRSMRKLESEMQVSLFTRTKNKMELNENGQLAVEHAKKILDDMQIMTNQIRQLDRSRRTISVASCAPAPLWEVAPILSKLYPEMTISTEMKGDDDLLRGLLEGTYQIIILTKSLEKEGVTCVKYGEEHLFFSLPPGHALSGSKALHLSDLNGETMLLRSKIGFWNRIHQAKMPDTRFLVQEDFAFNELVKVSALPSFTSDLVIKNEGIVKNRIIIPILDDEANVTFYLLYKNKDKKALSSFIQKMEYSQQET